MKWSVNNNPERGGDWHYYYLYGLERAGILYDTNMIGKHDWYLEGAKLLLDAQDGGRVVEERRPGTPASRSSS